LHVALEEVPRKPLIKPDGCFVFTDLKEGTYRLKITPEYYLKEYRVITLSEQGSSFPALNISLKPTFSYPYFSGATCCLASLRKDGKKAAGIRVRGTVLQESCAMARLAQDRAAGGEINIFLNKNGIIPVGDCLQIHAKESGATEYCYIAAIDYETNSFRLSSPLQNSYRRGDYFLPVRLFIFLEESIKRGTNWVVFEPNDERLWARVSRTIEAECCKRHMSNRGLCAPDFFRD